MSLINKPRSIYGVKDNQIQEVDDKDVDLDLISPNSFFSTHINLIPLQSAVQGPRLFYGARFYNQALPLTNAESPLVQNIDDSDQEPFDKKMGRLSGALYSNDDGEIEDVQPDFIMIKNADGTKRKVDVYNNFPFNRKTSITQTPLVKKGDKVTKGQILAKSNFTDDNGNLALGMNARVGLVPYKGYSFEDALVISKSFANKLSSDHSYTYGQQFDHEIKGGLNHYKSLFPTQFTKKQLEMLDDDGVIKPGSTVQPDDPLILATRPRVFSSTTSQLGKLSRAMKQSRHDSSKKWDGQNPGIVTDVAKTKKGVKVVIKTVNPTMVGDKVVFRSGQKGVVSTIIDDDHMPRTLDGKPLEVLLNPLGIPSRANNSMIYELLLGKVAKKLGKPITLPGFNKPGEKWHKVVRDYLNQAGLTETEEVFDPMTNRKLGQPITVGVGHVLKLHHTSASKMSSRSQGGYDADQQPLKGGSDAAQAKRLSGLEAHSLLSAGAYATLREGATLRGQKNDEYWRSIREGLKPKPPGRPFVWDKFRALISGAGMYAKDLNDGRMRLGPMTDDILESMKPFDIKSGDMVDINSLEPVPGGLFDQSIVGNNKWGRIRLPFAMPNPAFESSIRSLLGLTEKELRAILVGEQELPKHLM